MTALLGSCRQVWLWHSQKSALQSNDIYSEYSWCNTACKSVAEPLWYFIRYPLHKEISSLWSSLLLWSFWLQMFCVMINTVLFPSNINTLTVFICSFLLMAPLFGYLGDRYNRIYIMAGGLSVWIVSATGSSFVTKSVRNEFKNTLQERGSSVTKQSI